MDTYDPGRLLTPAQLAERWQCSRATVYALFGRGLPSVTIGRCRRVRVADADAWLATCSEEVGADGNAVA